MGIIIRPIGCNNFMVEEILPRQTPRSGLYHEVDRDHLFTQLLEENKNVLLNVNLSGLNKSSTLAINEMSAELEKMGKKVYRFGLGQSPFPVPEEVVQSLRDNAFQKDYLPVIGLEGLREAVCGYIERKVGALYNPKLLLVGPGSKELLFLVQLAFDGELILPSPSWVSYIPQAKIIGRKVRLFPTEEEHGWKISAKSLATLVEEDTLNDYSKPKILLLNYPNNPTGVTYTEGELRNIAKVARKANILVISDEIYGDLAFDGNYKSISRYYPEGTIISTGLSKWCGAGGWRLGVFIFPERLQWLHNAMSVIASETYTSVSAPIQHAAITAFKGSADIERYLDDSRRIFMYLGSWAAEVLRGAGITVNDPEGGFYLFLNFEKFEDSMNEQGVETSNDLTSKLLSETGVAILPGKDFSRPVTELTARLAFVNFDGGNALEATLTEYDGRELDLNFITNYAPEVKEGILKIVEWVEQFS